MTRRSSARASLLIAPLLAIVTFAVYAPVRHDEFVSFDDPTYIAGNPHITPGLSWDGVLWSLRHTHGGNWHPLTSVSHMIDCDLYGVSPGGHHLTSVAIHALNAVLLFLVLRSMTGSVWRSCLVAALFALHPLRVESVAWASERKDVLAGLFWMLTLMAYVRYVKRPGPLRYAIVASCLVLGLLSKPMVVTLPFVLLLLDVWPLRRAGVSWSRLIIEKLPLIGLAAAAAGVTYFVQRSVGTLASTGRLPLIARVENGLISYLGYLVKTIWPAKLAVYYPHPAYAGDGAISRMLAPAAGAAVVLATITVLALRFRRSRPHLGVGWLWYLGTLVPVIGIIQVGDQAMADRYTYLPQIGILLAIVWEVAELAKHRRAAHLVARAAAAATVIVLAVLTSRQLAHWRTSESLYVHTLGVTSGSYRIHSLLGQVYLEKGDLDAAENQFQRAAVLGPDRADPHASLAEVAARRGDLATAELRFRRAVELDADNLAANNNLGVLYARAGRYDEAAACLERVLAVDPDDPEARVNLGLLRLNQRRPELAVTHLTRAIELRPDYADAERYLGTTYVMLGNFGLAERHLRRAIELVPGDAGLQATLANVLASAGRIREAEDLYRAALQRQPDLAEASLALAWLLATAGDPSLRNGEEAVRLAERGLEASAPPNAEDLDCLAAAYAEAGRFPQAVATASRALALYTESGLVEKRAEIEARLRGYRSGRPFRSPQPPRN